MTAVSQHEQGRSHSRSGSIGARGSCTARWSPKPLPAGTPRSPAGYAAADLLDVVAGGDRPRRVSVGSALPVELPRPGRHVRVRQLPDFFSDPALLRALWNSFWTAGAATLGCVLLGVPLAYLVARTDLPFRRLVRTTSILTFAIPNFIVVLGWMLLLGPRSGLLNTPLQSWFGLTRARSTSSRHGALSSP